MKRIVTFFMAITMIATMALTMIACGGDDVTTTEATTTEATTTTKKPRPQIVLDRDYEGEGTAASPYLIDDADALKAMAKNADLASGHQGKFFKLTNNIDMTGQDWMPLSSFKGVFDGDGFAILNLAGEATPASYQDGNKKAGVFCGELDGDIKNVAFVNAQLTLKVATASQTQAGLIAGKMSGNCVITNVFVYGSVTTSFMEGVSGPVDCRVGAFAGYNDSAPTFENVVCRVAVNGAGSIYRLVGTSHTLTVTDTYTIMEGNTLNYGWMGNSSFLVYNPENENGVVNFYSTGVTGNNTYYSASFKDMGSAEFYANKEGKNLTVSDFYGDAMGFDAAEWNFYDDCAPIQKVFDGKCGDALKELVKE